MPNINDAFPSKYLKAGDLKGTEPIVTIDRVEMEDVGRDREHKAVVYFRGKDRGLVLNKTNANKLVQICGTPITESWGGHRIKLYATETTFGADLVDCIRIKAVSNGNGHAAAPPPPPPPVDHSVPVEDDEIPFAWLMPLVLPALATLTYFA